MFVLNYRSALTECIHNTVRKYRAGKSPWVSSHINCGEDFFLSMMTSTSTDADVFNAQKTKTTYVQKLHGFYPHRVEKNLICVRIPVMRLRCMLGSMFFWSPIVHPHSINGFLDEMVNYLPFSRSSNNMILFRFDPLTETLYFR